MFTGLVQTIGTLHSAIATSSGVRLVVNSHGWLHQPAIGDSIAVAGCCLTVAAVESAGLLSFDAIPETLAKTRLGRLVPGDRVNLEHAVTGATLMGGHFVQGHVDGVGVVEHVHTAGEWRVTIRPPSEILPALAPKGSVTVDGVSLTIARVAQGTFDIALIPVTLERTTLSTLRPGSPVNVEADILSKSVIRALETLAPHLLAPVRNPQP